MHGTTSAPGRVGRAALLGLWLGLAGLALAQPAAAQFVAGATAVPGPSPTPLDAPSLVERRAADDVTVRAVRVAAPLTIDGRLDEAIYATLPAIADFIQQEPREGQPATEKTEAWILYDDENLYICARNWDSQPDREVANEMRRDNGNILGNDNFTFVIDTLHDKRNGYMFQTNPLGALRDMTVTDDQQNSDLERHLVREDGALRPAAGRSRWPSRSRRCAITGSGAADLGHQPAPARALEERVFVPVARAGGPRHDRGQPHGLGRHA